MGSKTGQQGQGLGVGRPRGRPIFDEINWFLETLTSLASYPEMPRSVLRGLRDGDPTFLDAAIFALDSALTQHSLVGPHPARRMRAIPIKTISGGAVIALSLCEEKGLTPPPSLVHLFRRLLKVDRARLTTSRAFSAQSSAILVAAMFPNITPTELAREVNVNKSTASRWLRNDRFRHWVESMTPENAEKLMSRDAFLDRRERILRGRLAKLENRPQRR